MRLFILIIIVLVGGAWWYSAASAKPQYNSVYIEDYTWPELRERVMAGSHTVIIPTGGTEQNGPYLALGKHNAIVTFTAGEIARKLGDAVVAPVIAYVPEGRIHPPEGHMKFTGTISVRESTLAAVLEDAARSFKEHGFTVICFIGDHGGSQDVQQQVAENLTAEWRKESVQVLNISDYYAGNGQEAWAAKEYPKHKDPAAHAGFFDVSELLAADKRLVRQPLIKHYKESDFSQFGVKGDPVGGNQQAGAMLLNMKVDAAVKQIRALVQK